MSEELPPQIESDDEKFEDLIQKEDPLELGGEIPFETIEEKYENQLVLEKIVAPMMERLFKKDEPLTELEILRKR